LSHKINVNKQNIDIYTSHSATNKMTKIAIVYYSLYGHVATMAESIKEGIESTGATADIFQVAETLPEEVLTKMSAPPKKDYPVITANQLVDYDGIMFGVSGRYGQYSAQIKV
jgi:NAD(P)H dehydrogenase (quinone)